MFSLSSLVLFYIGGRIGWFIIACYFKRPLVEAIHPTLSIYRVITLKYLDDRVETAASKFESLIKLRIVEHYGQAKLEESGFKSDLNMSLAMFKAGYRKGLRDA